MTTISWYRRSVWNYKGNREYTKCGYDLAKERFNPDDLEVDCSDRHYVITGSNSGIGMEITREVAKRGGVLHMVCRNFEAAKAARSEIITNTGNDKIHIHTLDLARPREVLQWAQEFAATHNKIHVLVNNAGCMVHEKIIDEDGIETNFAVNTLSVHIITMCLLPVLQRNEDARVITVSSAGMLTVRLDPIDLMHEDMEPFNGRLVYSQNKRQQVIMTLWYAQRFDKVHFSVMHPGWADTPAVRTALPDFYEMMKDNLRTASEGADTAVWLAISKAALKHPSGLFFQDREPVSTHLPLAWTKTSIEEENLFMQKLMLLLQKISNEISPEQTEVNGDNTSEVNANILANGVKPPFESSDTNTKNMEDVTSSLQEVSLKSEDGSLSAKGETEEDRTENQIPVSAEGTKSEGQKPDVGEKLDEPEKDKILSATMEHMLSPNPENTTSEVLENFGTDSKEAEAGEKVEGGSIEKADTPSLENKEPAAQIGELVEKPTTPTQIEELVEKPTTPTQIEELVEKPTTPTQIEELVEKPTTPTQIEELVEKPTTPTHIEELVEKPTTPSLPRPDQNDNPVPETAMPDKNKKAELDTTTEENAVTVTSNTEAESKPETPQPEEKEEPEPELLKETSLNNGGLPSENQDLTSRPITSESKSGSNLDAAPVTSSPSPTPTDQTQLSAASVVEHLIDVTAARAGDHQHS